MFLLIFELIHLYAFDVVYSFIIMFLHIIFSFVLIALLIIYSSSIAHLYSMEIFPFKIDLNLHNYTKALYNFIHSLIQPSYLYKILSFFILF